MKISNIVESNIDYKKNSLLIANATCSGKCWKEIGMDSSICQNSDLEKHYTDMTDKEIISFVDRYVSDGYVEAVVFGGLEPLELSSDIETIKKVINFVDGLKKNIDIVIYTGFYKKEISEDFIEFMKKYKSGRAIIKYGRYIPDEPSVFDSILGVTLASYNQYSEVLNGK